MPVTGGTSPTDAAGRIVRVLPDVVGIHKTFDYRVPDTTPGDLVVVGSLVRARLHGRRTRGWIVATDVTPPDGVEPVVLDAVTGIGPAPDVVASAYWAARRWAGHPAHFLRTASPPTVVSVLPPAPRDRPVPVVVPGVPAGDLVPEALRGGPRVVRLAPGVDRFGFVVSAISQVWATGSADAAVPRRPVGSVIIACPTTSAARTLTQRLRRAGLPVAMVVDEGAGSQQSGQWSLAAAGGQIVVGARSVVWAPAPGLALGIVVDEHDEAHQSERTPTWNARDVLVQRCETARAPVVLLSPTPTLEAMTLGPLSVQSRGDERAGWPAVIVLDRRDEDPATRSGLFPPRLAQLLRGSGRAVCVLNRKGRVRLLGCRRCAALARCDVCGAAAASDDDGRLHCPRCGASRPMVCGDCGDTAFRVVRSGVSRARDDLEAVLGEPVFEVTGAAPLDDAIRAEMDRCRVLIGTEAVLHRVGQAEVVAFVDFDSELTAPRFRAGEQALALLARAARLAGPRRRGHRVVVQTRLPDHPVIAAAVHADPGRFTVEEAPLRAMLGLPPASALALISGPGAASFVELLRARTVQHGEVHVRDGDDQRWLVQAPDHRALGDLLASVERPVERVRVEVDPLRV